MLVSSSSLESRPALDSLLDSRRGASGVGRRLALFSAAEIGCVLTSQSGRSSGLDGALECDLDRSLLFSTSGLSVINHKLC